MGDFKLEEFVDQPTLGVFHKCKRDHLVAIADHYGITVSKTLNKQTIKSELLSALTEKGILPSQSPEVKESLEGTHVAGEAVRMKELDLEMRRLALQEKEMAFYTCKKIYKCFFLMP